MFQSSEYMEAIKNADLSEIIKLYKLERNFLIENFRYKEAILVQKKIESLIKKTRGSKTQLALEDGSIF